jgi:hypothetical protein
MKINRLTLLSKSSKPGYGVFLCDCGTSKEILVQAVKSGNTKSCGCLKQELKSKPKYVNHGMCGTPTYYSWTAMLSRCLYAGKQHYHGKGIKICQRWRKFENFLADMGERPRGMTLDRIDPNGNYEPSNCRWATHKDQCSNRTNNAWLTLNGERHTVQQWADITNIPHATIHMRLKRGWSVKASLTAPLFTRNPSAYD